MSKLRYGESVYADGYGRWHVIVQDSPLGLSRAIDLMADEIYERAPKGQSRASITAYLNKNMISRIEQRGLIHFVECDLT